MSDFQTPGPGKSGFFLSDESAPVIDPSVEIITDHDGSFTVPADKTGAIVHAQLQMTYPAHDDYVRTIVARVMADGAQISELGASDGNNQGGGASIYGSCVGVVVGVGVHTMSINMQVSGKNGAHGDGDFTYNQFQVGDVRFSGQAPLIATRTLTSNNYTSDQVGDPSMSFARMYVSFRHYVVQYY